MTGGKAPATGNVKWRNFSTNFAISFWLKAGTGEFHSVQVFHFQFSNEDKVTFLLIVRSMLRVIVTPTL